MKTMAYIAIVIGGITFTLAIISRATHTVIPIAGGMSPLTFLRLTNIPLLVAIIFISLEILKNKQ